MCNTKDVPGYCTCGAQLAEDALFCHKCGKPQREDLIVAERPPEPATLPPPIPVPRFPPIGFHNGPAVRIALLLGFLSIPMSILSGQLLPSALSPILSLVWLVGAGFMAVFLYRRRTGERLSVLHGAHLGWISGIFGFVLMTMLLTMVVVALSDSSVLAAMREQLKMSPEQQAQVNQWIDMIHSGPSGILMALLGTFLLFTILPAFGGALGAKLLDRD